MNHSPLSPQQWRKHAIGEKKKRRRGQELRRRLFPGGGKQTKFRWRKLIGSIVAFLILGGVALSLLLTILFAYFAKDLPDPNKINERSLAESTRIYDRTGEIVLYEVHGAEKRHLVKLEDIPKNLINATLSLEDQRFYEHKGFSLRGMLRAVVTDLLLRRKAQGASTLTQQFVKNAILSPEKTFARKFKELILSYEIEKRFTKDEILQLYFNEIPYGSVLYGSQAASQAFFNKDVKNISLAEAALLASIPKAPSYYSPYGSHVDELIGRQRHALDLMVEQGYVSETEAALAKQEKMNFQPPERNILAPHFVMYVKELLEDEYGERLLEEGGLKVVTTLDLYKQKIAEEEVVKGAARNLQNYNAENAALVSLDPKSGEILAMVGSKDYWSNEIDGQVNVVLRPRQPGSSFKPIVYAAAFLRGYTPETVLIDAVTVFTTGIGEAEGYEPHNYDNKEHGPVTVRKALAGSLNIPAVKMIYLTGIDKVLDLADRLGYSTFKDRSRYGLSLVLGGGEVTLLEHAAAYGALAREGLYQSPVAILSVEDKSGKKLFTHQVKSARRALDKEVAGQINDILSDNEARAYVFGLENNLILPDRPVAAKSGTTNDYRDGWTMGYTPSLVTGVWVGNNDNSEMKRGAAGGNVAAPIWHNYMSKVLTGTPVEEFNSPPTNTANKPALNGVDGVSEIKIKVDKLSGKLASNNTPSELIEERSYVQLHSILHYVNKDDPRGEVPTDPTVDPEYNNWETAINNWADSQGFTNAEVPTEEDDTHRPENKPVIQILSPANNTAFTVGGFLQVEVSTSSTRGVTQVEYLLDDQVINVTSASPFSLGRVMNDVTPGFHVLTATARDDVGNSTETSINLFFE